MAGPERTKCPNCGCPGATRVWFQDGVTCTRCNACLHCEWGRDGETVPRMLAWKVIAIGAVPVIVIAALLAWAGL